MQNLDPSAMGSGTCIRIGGRYFIATAAHVIMGRRFSQHFVLTPKLSNWSLRIVGGNVRGGGQGEYLDIGWLELHGRAAAFAERIGFHVRISIPWTADGSESRRRSAAAVTCHGISPNVESGRGPPCGPWATCISMHVH